MSGRTSIVAGAASSWRSRQAFSSPLPRTLFSGGLLPGCDVLHVHGHRDSSAAKPGFEPPSQPGLEEYPARGQEADEGEHIGEHARDDEQDASQQDEGSVHELTRRRPSRRHLGLHPARDPQALAAGQGRRRAGRREEGG